MTDLLDFEARLEERLRARAAIASRPFDAAAIAHQAAVVGGRSRFGPSMRLTDRLALRWAVLAVLALLALALVAAGVIVGSRLRDRPAPVLGSWTATGPMFSEHAIHTATVLLDGRVLVAGGVTEERATDATGVNAELYDPSVGTWVPTIGLNSGRWEHTATRLLDGRVLVTGGTNLDGALASAELYDPITGEWTAAARMTRARVGHTATLMLDGRVLVAGGAYPATSELFDPRHDTWTATGNLVEDRFDSAATLLPDGTVLIGGAGTAELYDPRSGTWTATGAMIRGRFEIDSAATLLPDGRVLVAGGDVDASFAELYDPRSGTWTATGPMIQRHGDQTTATLLPDGTVLVTGGTRPISLGIDPAISTADLYDPRTGTWTATANMSTNRRNHTATLLPDGTVLIAGGIAHDGAYGSAELYHPGPGN
jgi:hypothetical protein